VAVRKLAVAEKKLAVTKSELAVVDIKLSVGAMKVHVRDMSLAVEDYGKVKFHHIATETQSKKTLCLCGEIKLKGETQNEC
jgi:hypothetical protein